MGCEFLSLRLNRRMRMRNEKVEAWIGGDLVT